jgi:phosphoenolpyruvate-protein kinase (PTS system EI component)
VLEVKQIIMECDLKELGELARRALAAPSGAEVAAILEEFRSPADGARSTMATS